MFLSVRQVSILILLFAIVALLLPGTAAAQNPSTSVQTTWRLLDYVAVDYREAVRDGRVVNEAEYAEMREFARTARTNIEALPASATRQRLIGEARRLEQTIAAKHLPGEVDGAARSLAANLLAAYPVPLSPSASPDLGRGRA